MNKLFIVLLAVCLFSVVSAHTFVKRDAPTADEVTAQLNVVKNRITVLGNNLGKQIAGSVNPEVIKKTVKNFISAATKTLAKLKPAAADAKPAAQ